MRQEIFYIHNLLPEEEEYVDQNQFMYHYTNYNALKSILNNKCIWLTAFLQSNDLSEGRLLFEKVLERLELQKQNQIKAKLNKLFTKIMENAYVGSFCSYGNKLSQWRGYGNINIGFDYDLFSNGQYFIVDKNGKQHYTSGLFFAKCDYVDPSDKPSLKIRVEEFLKNFIDIENADLENRATFQYNALKLGLLLFPIKHKGFFEESEYRAIHYLWNVLPFNHPCKDKLYIKLLFDKKTVKRIVVGPSKDQEETKDKVISFLDNVDSIYNHVDIYCSAIPYVKNE